MTGRLGRTALALWVVAMLVPVATLGLQAAADAWYGDARWPQALGTRGLSVAFGTDGRATEAVVNSTLVAALATLAALWAGWPAARVLALRAGGRGRPLLWAALALPVIVPPYALGVGLAPVAIRTGLADSVAGLVVAHAVVVTPYVVVTLAAAVDGRLVALEEAAAGLGTPPLRRLLTVTVPTLAPAVATAAALGFIVSWSQYGLSLGVGGGIPMLPLELVPFVGRDPQVAAVLALVFLVPPLLALALTVRVGRAARAGGAAA